MKYILLLFIVSFSYLSSFAQEHEEEKKNLLSASLGYTFIPQGSSLEEEEADGIFIPSIGLDYFHRLHPRWEIGLMVDLELGEYVVRQKELNRKNALAFIAVGSFTATKHLNLFAGGGMEFERHHNLGVIRLGAEYVFRLKNNWVISPGFIYDFKEGFDTWSLSFAFGKEF
jgi:hypothetical protein